MWEKIKKPFAAAVGVTVGGVCALLVSHAEVVNLDPSSIVFVTVLLVDMSSAEAFYVTATFRIIGTLFGLLAGAGVSFVSNAIVATGESAWGLHSFQLACMALFVFAAFYVEVNYPKYGYVSIIFVYTATALVFAGTTNAVTIATVAAVIGGCVIATTVMWIFNYESAEATLLRGHQTLVSHVMNMIKWSVRANPRYREDYFKIMDDTKTAFDTNADSISNYVRWMRWTRRQPPFDFVALTKALRPLYNQTAAFFWAMCRERVLGSATEQYLDARYLFCLTSDNYFEFFHGFVTELVESLESMQGKLETVFRQHPNDLIRRLREIKSTIIPSRKPVVRGTSVDTDEIFFSILRDDMHVILKSIIKMKHRYTLNKASFHPQFAQQWLFSDYLYQIALILLDLLDYLGTTITTVCADHEVQTRLLRKLRVLTIHTERIGSGAFLQTEATADTIINLDELADRLLSQSTDDDVISVVSANQRGGDL